MTQGRRHFRPFVIASLVWAAWAAGARGWAAESEATPPRVFPAERAAIEFRFSRNRLTEADRHLLNELASLIDEEGRPRFDMKTERESFLAVAWACWLLEAEAFNSGRPLVETNRAGGLAARELNQRFRWRQSDLGRRAFGPTGQPTRPAPQFGIDPVLVSNNVYFQRFPETQGMAWATFPAPLSDGMRLFPNALEVPSISNGFNKPIFTSFEQVNVARLAMMDANAWPTLIVGLTIKYSSAPFDSRNVHAGSMIGISEPTDLAQAAKTAMPETSALATLKGVATADSGAPFLGSGPADREAWSAALSIPDGLSLRSGISAWVPTLLFGTAPAWLYGDIALQTSVTGSLSRGTTQVDHAWMADNFPFAVMLTNASFQHPIKQPNIFLHGLYVTKPGDRPSTNLGTPALAGGMSGWAAWRALLRDENAPVIRHADPEALVFARDEILRTLAPSRVSIDGRINQGLDFAWKLHRRTGETFTHFRRAAERADGSWTNDARGLAALTAWAMKQRAWDDALALAEAWLERDDSAVEAWYSVTQSAWETRRLDLVDEYGTGLLDAFPASARRANAYWLLGLAAGAREKTDVQKQWWNRLIEEYPKSNDAKEAKKRLTAPPPKPTPSLPPPVHEDIDVF